MSRDDEVIERYEQEFGEPPARRSNRGFWMVAGTLIVGSTVLLSEIFLNRPIANDIARSQHDLQIALDRAEAILSNTGSLQSADADGIARGGEELMFVAADVGSTGPGVISVFASSELWAATVRAETGTCFSIKRSTAGETTYLIADGECTGLEGLAAVDDRW
jgi:hypothetical protein